MAIQSIAVNNARYEGVTSEMQNGLSGGITADGQEEEDRSYMTTQDADSDGTSGLKDSPEPPQPTELELDAYGLPVQKRARTARTACCLALASLICAIVAVGLVIAEIITHRKPAPYLFFLGWLPGFAAAFLAIPGSLSGVDERTKRIASYGARLGVLSVFAWVIATGHGAALNNVP